MACQFSINEWGSRGDYHACVTPWWLPMRYYGFTPMEYVDFLKKNYNASDFHLCVYKPGEHVRNSLLFFHFENEKDAHKWFLHLKKISSSF